MKTLNISSSNNCKIKDLFLVQPESFCDFRGENFEGYNEKSYNEIFSSSENWVKGNNKFIVDSFSKSRKDFVQVDLRIVFYHFDNDFEKIFDSKKN